MSVWVPCCLICQVHRLERGLFVFTLPCFFQICTQSSFETLWVQIWLAPIVTENEFILNTKVTITHASFHPHPPPCTPIFLLLLEEDKHQRKLPQWELLPVSQLSNDHLSTIKLLCFSLSLVSPVQIYKEKGRLFFTKCSVSVAEFKAETCSIFLMKLKGLLSSDRSFPCSLGVLCHVCVTYKMTEMSNRIDT